jgi:hypothetical protein
VPTGESSAGKAYVELLVDDEHMYHYQQFSMRADNEAPRGGPRNLALNGPGMASLASGLLAAAGVLDAGSRGDDEVYCPFDASVRLEWDEAMSLPFFQKHYGAEDRGENGSWRRVNNDWLVGASSLALRADGFTNNISMVLAFDVPNSKKMLLFVGDAQVGNWRSWHRIPAWRMLGDAAPKDPPAAIMGGTQEQTLIENLLGRVAFYKVGHHGSHNATIRQRGLELMTRDDLIAYIPVSVPVAQDLMGYCPMPFYPVVRRVQEKTKGRVFLANGQAVEPLPEGATQASLRGTEVELSTDTLDPKVQAGVGELEGAVPLYIEVTIQTESSGGSAPRRGGGDG